MNILFELVVAVIATRALRCRRRCVLKLETKEEMHIYIFFLFLGTRAGAACRCTIATFILFFFFSLKKKSARMSDFFSVSSRLSNTHTHITLIIILIIDVFWLVAFACVKYRTASLTNDGSEMMRRVRTNEQHNRSDFYRVSSNQKKEEDDKE
jgi:hypothetical protein